jgi:hypothetical protein
MLALVEDSEMVAVLAELAVLGQSHAIDWRPLTAVVERRLIAATRVGQGRLPALCELLDELGSLTLDGAAG